MSGCSLRRKVCPFFLCQCHLSAVLLRVLLGEHPLTRRPRVPQTAGEGGRRSTSARVLPLELITLSTHGSPLSSFVLENKYHGISVHYILCLQTEFESARSNVALWHKRSMLTLIRMLCFNSLIILRLIGLVLRLGNIRQCETIIYTVH